MSSKNLIFYFCAAFVFAWVACSDDEDSKTESPAYAEFEKELAGRSWVMNLAGDMADLEILCQYDLRSDHSALCQVMSVVESKEGLEYTLDSAEVRWSVVPEYKGYQEAGLVGPALRIEADTTETYMLIKSVDKERMICVTASGEQSEEVVFDRILEGSDLDESNNQLRQVISSKGEAPILQGSARSDWMKDIPDTVKVCDMSIPGTHDATTYNVAEAISFGARCQDLNLSQQWDAGVRVFDLRMRQSAYSGETASNLNLYHDFIPCNLSLASALNTLVAKVQEHKDTDGAIIICKTEGNHYANKVGMFSGVLSWVIDFVSGVGLNFSSEKLNETETLLRYGVVVENLIVNQGLLAEFKPDMTMQDLRGKILIINRNDQPVEACYGAHASGWGSGKTLTALDGMENLQTAPLQVQDEYEPDENEGDDAYMRRKMLVFEDMWVNSYKYAPNTWVVNQASGYVYDLAFPDYATLAEKVYPTITEMVRQCPGKGLILQDYAGVDKTCRLSAKVTAPFAITALAVPNCFGFREKALSSVLKLAKMVLPDDYVKGNQLVDAVISNNFR